jgi:uncharacterized membrane protein
MNGPTSLRPPHRARGRVLVVVRGLVSGILGALLLLSPVSGEDATVRAVLFYSPTCPHCHQVIDEDLPPVQARFGDQLEVLLVDVSTLDGATLYEAAVAAFDVPDDRIGVPTLVIGDVVLVGSVEIPEQLPMRVERALASGGTDWPPIPGLAGPLPSPLSTPSPPPAEATSVVALVARDPIGNTLAIVVLVGLLIAMAWAAAAILRAPARSTPGPPSWWIPLLALTGLSVAAYLSGVELTGGSAVCGPVGDCNLVHTSVYARLFGIPIGLIGVAGYVSILGSWVVARRSDGMLGRVARIGLIAVAITGTLFSVYLTFLEPFVLGATCAWCLASAVIIGAILVMATASSFHRVTTR